MAIDAIRFSSTPIVAPESIPLRPQAPAAPGAFQAVFRSAVEGVNAMQGNATDAVTKMLAGETEDLHRVALEQQRAAIGFDLFLQVRNKVVNAYQEVMRMPV